MSTSPAWDDLAPRLISAAVMVVVGLGLIWLGGWPFLIFASVVGGLMVWEAARMFGSETPALDGGFAGLVLFLALAMPGVFSVPLLFASAFLSTARVKRDRLLYGGFHAAILLAAFSLVLWREGAGLWAVVWLVAVVVASDVMGYFAGRLLGGPKFWPSVSPKKTWSGTIAGWVGAGAVGAAFATASPLGWVLVPLSVFLAFAGQMGDIAESAVKRRMGVKDSSNLIPGHGGVLDRCDALMGASLLTLGFAITGFGG